MIWDWIRLSSMSKNSDKLEKTLVMKILDREHISYTSMEYDVSDENYDGNLIAAKTGINPNQMFKTLVMTSNHKLFVFCIPVNQEVDLKKAAKAVGEKSVEMVHVKDLCSLTGYVRGGCSPIGMKKQSPTTFHQTLCDFETVYVSAGKRGVQIGLKPQDLIKVVNGKTADIIAVHSI